MGIYESAFYYCIQNTKKIMNKKAFGLIKWPRHVDVEDKKCAPENIHWWQAWLLSLTSFKVTPLSQRRCPSLIAKWARIKFPFRIEASFGAIFAAPVFASVHFDCICLVQGVTAKWAVFIFQFLFRLSLGSLRWREFFGDHLIPKSSNLYQRYWWVHYWTTINQFQSEIRCSLLYQVLCQI